MIKFWLLSVGLSRLPDVLIVTSKFRITRVCDAVTLPGHYISVSFPLTHYFLTFSTPYTRKRENDAFRKRQLLRCKGGMI